jgi:pimeloyl-ACP methyl ester carboxylesterase
MTWRWRNVFRAVWACAGLTFTAWIVAGFQPVDLPADVLASSETVTVEKTSEGSWRFQPVSNAKATTLVFLPGGMVDPMAYAPLLRGVAANGYPAVLMPLPWRCGCTESQRSELFEGISREARRGKIFLAGHSRGAMLAVTYLRHQTGNVAGAVLLGTTHPRDFPLRGLTLSITKVYGTNDGVAPYADMKANAHLLPASTRWVGIEGGNHTQFGYYRHQLMSGEASISRAEQQRQVEAAILSALQD